MLQGKFNIIWLLPLLLLGCQSANIPKAYQFNLEQSVQNPYGCWVVLSYGSNSASTKPAEYTNSLAPTNTYVLQGELLCRNADSLYILVSDGNVVTISDSVIVKAELYTHKNQANNYLLITLLVSAPAIIGGIAAVGYTGYIVPMALPQLLTGVAIAGTENDRQKNVRKYPPLNLEDITQFARYPGGLPIPIDFSTLTLKK